MTVGHPDEPCLALCNIAAQTIVHQKTQKILYINTLWYFAERKNYPHISFNTPGFIRSE